MYAKRLGAEGLKLKVENYSEGFWMVCLRTKAHPKEEKTQHRNSKTAEAGIAKETSCVAGRDESC
jgi:hypothetical protein